MKQPLDVNDKTTGSELSEVKETDSENPSGTSTVVGLDWSMVRYLLVSTFIWHVYDKVFFKNNWNLQGLSNVLRNQVYTYLGVALLLKGCRRYFEDKCINTSSCCWKKKLLQFHKPYLITLHCKYFLLLVKNCLNQVIIILYYVKNELKFF